MRPTFVYIICSPRPLVGKTLLARLMSEFQLLKNGEVSAFDINLREPSLLDYLPDITETAEINDTHGKMALMDRLIVNDGITKVIDLGFHAFDEFFTMCEEIGFIKEAARRGVQPIVMFLADVDRTSVRAQGMLKQQIPAGAMVTIDNEYILRGEMPEHFAAYGRVIQIAALQAFLKNYVDRLSFSFTAYLRSQKDASSELHEWIRENYISFRDLEQELIAEKR
jgi:hypothetical protein